MLALKYELIEVSDAYTYYNIANKAQKYWKKMLSTSCKRHHVFLARPEGSSLCMKTCTNYDRWMRVQVMPVASVAQNEHTFTYM